MVLSNKPKRRWRQPLSKHIALMAEHLEVFMAARGQCRHFVRFDADLMLNTLNLYRDLKTYNRAYVTWLRKNVSNCDRFLPQVKDHK
jgi:hypothetical protein